ncbi:hypothetical protein KSP40_PGU001011 [Platanthera guangdongensis]|uniref:Uncharacterized protein n=1 Tax=Platanthera guangdongensis TaxID=2320717 RepID=A0ABR2LW52_9ASPA
MVINPSLATITSSIYGIAILPIEIRQLEISVAATSGIIFIFSPLSLIALLSLMAFSARGEMLRLLLSFLGCPNLDHLHSASNHLSQAVYAVYPELILSFVNRA